MVAEPITAVSLRAPPSACSLLIMSCDAYADLWRPFFTLLRRHWPDCPFRIYLGAEAIRCPDPNIASLNSTAGGRNWSGRLIDYLHNLQTPYVIIMLDDFFLRRRVSTDQVMHCLNFASSRHAVQVRLIPRPGPTHRIPDEPIVGECAPGLSYRLSTQAAIWDRFQLLSLLRSGESIWDFEHNGNVRISAAEHGFYAVRKAALPYDGSFSHHVVEKGKWFPLEKWIFASKRIGCDFSQRGTLPWRHALLCYFARGVDLLASPLPWRLSKRIKLGLKRLAAPFLGRRLTDLKGLRSGPARD